MNHRPAEFSKGKTIWLAWPFSKPLWGHDLEKAQEEVRALISSLKEESLALIFPSSSELEKTKNIISHPNIIYKVLPYGDIWLRDTFPLFVTDAENKPMAVIPKFNGWGEKYLFDDDVTLANRAADLFLVKKISSSLIFEGGAIESNGEGCFLTTEQCLLNSNRNPLVSKETIEKELFRLFGAKKIIWLKEGLKNDHTDGHIDTLARFINPHTIAIMTPTSKDDPNFSVLKALKNDLAAATDAEGKSFSLLELPSPGTVLDRNGQLMPASYLNFIIGDHTLVMPLYGSMMDKEAEALLTKAVDLKVIGISAKAILSGGGAFHCISQEWYG